LLLKSRFQVFDIRLMGYRRKRERVSPGRISRIIPRGAVNRQELFSPLIVGFELFVCYGPGGRHSFFVLERGKIFFSEAGERGAIHFRVSTYEIVNSRRERFAARVVPGLIRLVAFMIENGFRTPVLWLLRKKVSALNQQDLHPGILESVGQHTAAHACSDDDQIVVWGAHEGSLVLVLVVVLVLVLEVLQSGGVDAARNPFTSHVGPMVILNAANIFEDEDDDEYEDD